MIPSSRECRRAGSRRSRGNSGILNGAILREKSQLKLKRARGNPSDSRRQLEGEEDLGGVRGNGEDLGACEGEERRISGREKEGREICRA